MNAPRVTNPRPYVTPESAQSAFDAWVADSLAAQLLEELNQGGPSAAV